MPKAFNRMGAPIRIPVSPTSASAPFPTAGKLPANFKTFMFVNPNPFDIRLEGSANAEGTPNVTATTGWLVLARSVMGPFTSKNPAAMTVMAVATPGMPLPSGFDYSSSYIELFYGDGE